MDVCATCSRGFDPGDPIRHRVVTGHAPVSSTRARVILYPVPRYNRSTLAAPHAWETSDAAGLAAMARRRYRTARTVLGLGPQNARDLVVGWLAHVQGPPTRHYA